MRLYFKDRMPEAIHGENARYYDAVGDDGTVRLGDFKLLLKNSIAPDKQGDPVNAANLNYASGNAEFEVGKHQNIKRGSLVTVNSDGTVSAVKIVRNAAGNVSPLKQVS